jgi:hypothetical protein
MSRARLRKRKPPVGDIALKRGMINAVGNGRLNMARARVADAAVAEQHLQHLFSLRELEGNPLMGSSIPTLMVACLHRMPTPPTKAELEAAMSVAIKSHAAYLAGLPQPHIDPDMAPLVNNLVGNFFGKLPQNMIVRLHGIPPVGNKADAKNVSNGILNAMMNVVDNFCEPKFDQAMNPVWENLKKGMGIEELKNNVPKAIAHEYKEKFGSSLDDLGKKQIDKEIAQQIEIVSKLSEDLEKLISNWQNLTDPAARGNIGNKIDQISKELEFAEAGLKAILARQVHAKKIADAIHEIKFPVTTPGAAGAPAAAPQSLDPKMCKPLGILLATADAEYKLINPEQFDSDGKPIPDNTGKALLDGALVGVHYLILQSGDEEKNGLDLHANNDNVRAHAAEAAALAAVKAFEDGQAKGLNDNQIRQRASLAAHEAFAAVMKAVKEHKPLPDALGEGEKAADKILAQVSLAAPAIPINPDLDKLRIHLNTNPNLVSAASPAGPGIPSLEEENKKIDAIVDQAYRAKAQAQVKAFNQQMMEAARNADANTRLLQAAVGSQNMHLMGVGRGVVNGAQGPLPPGFHEIKLGRFSSAEIHISEHKDSHTGEITQSFEYNFGSSRADNLIVAKQILLAQQQGNKDNPLSFSSLQGMDDIPVFLDAIDKLNRDSAGNKKAPEDWAFKKRIDISKVEKELKRMANGVSSSVFDFFGLASSYYKRKCNRIIAEVRAHNAAIDKLEKDHKYTPVIDTSAPSHSRSSTPTPSAPPSPPPAAPPHAGPLGVTFGSHSTHASTPMGAVSWGTSGGATTTTTTPSGASDSATSTNAAPGTQQRVMVSGGVSNWDPTVSHTRSNDDELTPSLLNMAGRPSRPMVASSSSYEVNAPITTTTTATPIPPPAKITTTSWSGGHEVNAPITTTTTATPIPPPAKITTTSWSGGHVDNSSPTSTPTALPPIHPVAPAASASSSSLGDKNNPQMNAAMRMAEEDKELERRLETLSALPPARPSRAAINKTKVGAPIQQTAATPPPLKTADIKQAGVALSKREDLNDAKDKKGFELPELKSRAKVGSPSQQTVTTPPLVKTTPPAHSVTSAASASSTNRGRVISSDSLAAANRDLATRDLAAAARNLFGDDTSPEMKAAIDIAEKHRREEQEFNSGIAALDTPAAPSRAVIYGAGAGLPRQQTESTPPPVKNADIEQAGVDLSKREDLEDANDEKGVELRSFSRSKR